MAVVRMPLHGGYRLAGSLACLWLSTTRQRVAGLLPRIVGVAIAVVSSGGAGGCGAFRDSPDRVLSDADLSALQEAPFNKGRLMNQSFAVGRHQGVPVRVDFPCGDICPDYTAKLIRYDVPPSACPPQGEVVTLGVPGAAALILRDFCVPRVLGVKGIPRPTNQ